MDRFRFSTRTMLIGFACVAVVLAALARPSEVTAWLATRCYYLAILAALLGVIFRTGTARAYWIGFAIFGWGPIVLAHWISIGWPKLFDVPIRFLHRQYFGAPLMEWVTNDLQLPYLPPPTQTPERIDWNTHFAWFSDIAAAASALALALAGGALAVYLDRTREQTDTKPKGDVP